MTDLDERIYCSEEQFITYPDVTVDDRQNLSMMMATSSGTTIPGLKGGWHHLDSTRASL